MTPILPNVLTPLDDGVPSPRFRTEFSPIDTGTCPDEVGSTTTVVTSVIVVASSIHMTTRTLPFQKDMFPEWNGSLPCVESRSLKS